MSQTAFNFKNLKLSGSGTEQQQLQSLPSSHSGLTPMKLMKQGSPGPQQLQAQPSLGQSPTASQQPVVH